jgi:hypothetical protein
MDMGMDMSMSMGGEPAHTHTLSLPFTACMYHHSHCHASQKSTPREKARMPLHQGLTATLPIHPSHHIACMYILTAHTYNTTLKAASTPRVESLDPQQLDDADNNEMRQ